MTSIETIIIIMTILVGLNYFSTKIKVSFPILLVIAGLVISIIPGIPEVSLSPNVVFLIFLPPLLYEASFNISWHDFKRLITPISGLAIGLVLLTTAMVAGCIHFLMPSFSWPLAFLLGAIVSPPDAIAATSATKGLRLPKVITTILEGESLVNDASALIAYRYALAAVVSGTFSLTEASYKFVIIAGGGILIGLLIGSIVYWVHKKVDDPAIETTVSIVAPYMSYLVAEHLDVSGVLAVVSTGLFVAWYSSELFAVETRLKMLHFWEILIFLLNGFVFILIGLQLPKIIQNPGNLSIMTLTWFGIIISIVAILARVLWIFPISHLIYYISHCITGKKSNYKPKWNYLITAAWSGMRGVVSLASALAIPISLNDGSEFPMRNEILFITFVVILITLVFQGLTLPLVVKKLKIEEPIEDFHRADRELRLSILNNTLKFIQEELSTKSEKEVLEIFVKENQKRIKYFNQFIEEEALKDYDTTPNDPEINFSHIQLELDIIEFQRKLIIDMHKKGTFSDELIRQIEGELDTWNLSMRNRMRIVNTHKLPKKAKLAK